MKLCSILVPTRKRIGGLVNLLQSLRETATDESRIEVLVRADEDDNETVSWLNGAYGFKLKCLVGPRENGYGSLGHFLSDLSKISEGEWAWPLDDDCTIVGKGWDQQLSAIQSVNCIVHTEFYQIGQNRYGSHLVGGIYPNHCWEAAGFSEIGNPPDAWLDSVFRESKRWPVHILKGITLHHHWRPHDWRT